MVFFMTSCSNQYIMTRHEFKISPYSVSGVFIYKDSVAVAELTNVEFEYIDTYIQLTQW